MNWLSLMSGMMGAQGQGQGQGNLGNAYGVQQGQQQPQWGMEALQQGPQQLQQVQQSAEFGTQGTPPSLAAQLAQNTVEQQGLMPNIEPSFDQYISQQPDPMGMVLPQRGEVQPKQAAALAPQAQSFNAGGGQPMPMGQPYQQPQGAAPQSGFGSFFNMTGTAPSSPGSEQPFDPNMFLRMSEGYNRGGLLGALGMLLTDYK